MISVAMTTYNGAAYLEQQLQSLMAQTRCPDEVVICDDGSKDGTVAIARRFIRENRLTGWTVVENPANLGYIRNFRKAMGLTRGEIVFLCDQDDVWHRDKIRKMAAVLEENRDICALASGYTLIDGNGETYAGQAKRFYTPAGKGPLSRVEMGTVFHKNMAQGCACAYRRELLERYETVSETSLLPHDWALNLLAYQQGRLFFLNETLLFYRIHGSNTLGVPDQAMAVSQRIPRLAQYRDCILEAGRLPMPREQQRELERIAAFLDIRIRWLQTDKLSVWLSGITGYFPVFRRYFFRSYLKDLYLGCVKKERGQNRPGQRS